MRPSPFEEATEGRRHHGEARRHAHERALRTTRLEHPSTWAGLEAAIMNLVRRDHSLTDYPCRLPDGKIGRTAVVMSGGEWTMVCRVA
jgi:hypothetical protein